MLGCWAAAAGLLTVGCWGIVLGHKMLCDLCNIRSHGLGLWHIITRELAVWHTTRITLPVAICPLD